MFELNIHAGSFVADRVETAFRSPLHSLGLDKYMPADVFVKWCFEAVDVVPLTKEICMLRVECSDG